MLVKKYKKENKVLEIHTDESPESPREWDNLGVMVCAHKQYNLGDIQVNSKEELDEKLKDAFIKLPLYLYDHSGLSISTKNDYPFNDQWDAGQVGFIIVSESKLKKEYQVKEVTKEIIDKAKQVLINEVDTYDRYLRGEIYGFETFELEKCNMNEEHKKDLDSCWGFYSIDSILDETNFKDAEEVLI